LYERFDEWIYAFINRNFIQMGRIDFRTIRINEVYNVEKYIYNVKIYNSILTVEIFLLIFYKKKRINRFSHLFLNFKLSKIIIVTLIYVFYYVAHLS